MSEHRNNVANAVSGTPGTGTITLASAVTGSQSFSAAYGANATVDVFITDGTAWEVARNCTYTHSGTTLTRGTLEASSTGSAISLTSAAVVRCAMPASTGNSLNAVVSGYIEGCEMVWNSATSISVDAGCAHIQASGLVLSVPSTLTASSLSLTANTWYHVYIYDNAGTAAIEVVITAPASAYFGTARSKTGDSTRRYIGSIRAVATNSAEKFSHDWRSNLIIYRNAAATATYRILNGGTATTSTAIDCSSLIPSSSRLVWIKASNTDTAVTFVVGSNDDTQESASTSGYFSVAPSIRAVIPVPCSNSQQLAYDYQLPTPSSGNAFIDILGYQYSR